MGDGCWKLLVFPVFSLFSESTFSSTGSSTIASSFPAFIKSNDFWGDWISFFICEDIIIYTTRNIIQESFQKISSTANNNVGKKIISA
mmetsp:Transcript_885/g.1084  ORF Transcript_885/g.1084 Transcript_885/m.1084 type:complete len:88 (+) Transcript_885:406-669(+)